MKTMRDKRGLTGTEAGEDPVAALRREAGDHPAFADEAAWRFEPAVMATGLAMQELARMLGRIAARKVERSASPSQTEPEGARSDD